MFKPSPIARILLHLANLPVIAFFLLSLAAVAIGSVQSERSLQANTRAVSARDDAGQFLHQLRRSNS